ncbi:MAG TPA: aspartyl/asparaginyl beta-hydroxylase domain-containing protein [Steroidobacteraceae bacterium]
MNTPAVLDDAAVIRTLQSAKAAAAAGRAGESDQILVALAQRVPNHPAVLNELGVRMLDRREAAQARALFERATKIDPNHPSLWANLASSLKALGRGAEEMDALQKALELAPRHLSALLQKGAYQEDTGDLRGAARTYQSALATIAPGTEPAPHIREALARARRVVDQDQATLTSAMEGPLAEVRARHGGAAQRRVDACLEALMGRRSIYHSQPTWMYFPELPAIEFFDRAEFAWLDALEAASEQMRAELMRVLIADREGLQPYIDFPPDMPLDQFRELNRSRRWSAYFLWNQGAPDEGHIARCPMTARALEEHAPRPRITRRAPTAFFSVLDAKTRIPAHTGVTNTRLTVHLPLVVPPGCGFRVGGTTREWVPGRAWVFDDTIEHEAWNDSDTPRAILIFDIWNPLLSAAEREMIAAATQVYVNHYALSAETGL